MIKNSGNRGPRRIISPEERETREAERLAKIRAKTVERVADAAILHHMNMGSVHQTPDLSDTMNNGERTGGDASPHRLDIVELDPALLGEARAVLRGRIESADEEHAKTVGKKSEATSAASTQSATLLLRGAIKQINRELLLRAND